MWEPPAFRPGALYLRPAFRRKFPADPYSSMTGLAEVVARLQEVPATEPIASEISGASALSHFCSMKNHLGKFYSPSTAMML